MTSQAGRWRPVTSYSFALLLISAGIALATLIPLGFIIVSAISVGWDEAYRLIVRPRVGELLVNTAALILAAVPLSGAIGLAAAWLVERTNVSGRPAWAVLMAAPLAVPAFVNSFSWVSLTPKVEGYAGATLICTLSYFPLVFLPVAAALRGIDPALEETARSLGFGPFKTFRWVVLPQLRTALFGGMLLVALHLLAEFGALQMLRFPTFTTAIYDQYQSTFNGAPATMLAGVLVILCLLILLAEIGARGGRRYSRVGSGTARIPARVCLGPLNVPAVLGLTGVVVLSLGVPIGSLVHWMVIGSSTVFPVDTFISTTLSSIALGLLGAIVTSAMAFPIAWVATRRRGLLAVIIERSTYVAHALPGIVVALALVTVAVRYFRPLYQSLPVLLFGYAILFLPLAMVSIRAGIVQAPPALDEAARSLGARPLDVLRRVTLPLIAPGIGAGAVLVFLSVATELTSTLLLAPTGTETLAMRFWIHAQDIAYGAAAPYAVIMILISTPITYFLTHQPPRPENL